jgi:hypothetical protein
MNWIGTCVCSILIHEVVDKVNSIHCNTALNYPNDSAWPETSHWETHPLLQRKGILYVVNKKEMLQKCLTWQNMQLMNNQ